MSEALIVKDLCKTYITNKRQNNILKNVNFTVNDGEMVAIMGPSGSGKSTLLYSVSGMDKPTSGKVTLAGKEITELKEKDLADVRLKHMGFIFQQMHMLKNLNIIDNIVLPGYQAGEVDRKEIDDYGKQLMNKLGIIDIAENDVTEVSGGQLQRACICRSLINKPDIVFADEPTGALNRSSSEDVMDQLVKLNADGTTILMVTHDMKVAAKCGRIMYIEDGNIKGEFSIPSDITETKERQRKVNNWLNEMGW